MNYKMQNVKLCVAQLNTGQSGNQLKHRETNRLQRLVLCS